MQKMDTDIGYMQICRSYWDHLLYWSDHGVLSDDVVLYKSI